MMDNLHKNNHPGNWSDKKSRHSDRALKFVVTLALTIALTVAVCSLVWWFTSIHSYDILGRNINIGGVILVVFGTITMGRGGNVALRKYTGMRAEEDRRGDVQHRNNYINRSSQSTLVTLNFFGAGLLCLFIGNLILLGL